MAGGTGGRGGRRGPTSPSAPDATRSSSSWCAWSTCAESFVKRLSCSLCGFLDHLLTLRCGSARETGCACGHQAQKPQSGQRKTEGGVEDAAQRGFAPWQDAQGGTARRESCWRMNRSGQRQVGGCRRGAAGPGGGRRPQSSTRGCARRSRGGARRARQQSPRAARRPAARRGGSEPLYKTVGGGAWA